MVAGGLLFVAVAVLVRHLGSDLPAVEAAFIRYVFGLLILIPVFLRMQWRRVRGANLKFYALRGVAHGAAVMLWFFAMARIPISEVTAIGYTTPIFTVVGAVLIFGERIHMRRIIAIIIGFVGILIILRPGFATIEIARSRNWWQHPVLPSHSCLRKNSPTPKIRATRWSCCQFFARSR